MCLIVLCNFFPQALKNAKANLKKTTKNLSKEKEKLAELERVPEKMEKEIKELERKIKILENRKSEEEEKLAQVMESECGDAFAAVRWSGVNLGIVSLCCEWHLCMSLIQLLVEVIVQRLVTAVTGVV